MKKVGIRNFIICLLCLTIICMAVGFSIVSSKLYSFYDKKEKFNVVFTKIKEDMSVKGATINPTCKTSLGNENHTINMNFTLNSPNDKLSYILVIKNESTMDVEIIDIIKTPDYINDLDSKESIYPIVIKTTDVSGKVLSPQEELEMKVEVFYNQIEDDKKISFPYQLSILAKSKVE